MKNNNKKILSAFVFILLCVVVFTGCSASFDSAKSTENNAVVRDGYYYDYASNAGYDNYESELYDYEKTSSMSNNSGLSNSNMVVARKIIRDAEITIDVENPEKSYENILTYLTSLGGYETSRNVSSYGDNNYRSADTATLKVPTDKLDLFLSELKKEGDIKNSYISSSDITDQYYDSMIRLETLEKTLENYYRFLENAKDVEEQLQVTRYINDVTREIEQLKGSLTRWDSLVNYSTVTLYLYRPYEAPVEERVIEWSSLSVDDMLWLMSSGFVKVCSTIFSLIQWIFVIIITLSPIIIPIAVILFIAIWRYRKKTKIRKKNMQNKQDELK